MLPPSPPTDPDAPISSIRFLTGELRSIGVAVDDPGRWQRMPGEERVEAGPCEQPSSRSTFQPLMPYSHDLVAIPLQPPNVSRDAIVGIVTNEYRRQAGALFGRGP